MKDKTKADKSSGPSFCWHCMQQLQWKKSGGFFFKVVKDQDGNVHRVHVDCLPQVIGDGVREVKA